MDEKKAKKRSFESEICAIKTIVFGGEFGLEIAPYLTYQIQRFLKRQINFNPWFQTKITAIIL